MPKPRVRRVQEIKLENIHFCDVTQNNYGGKVVYLKYTNDDGEKVDLYLQTPKMTNSWGIHVSQARDPKTKEPTGDPRYYLQLSFGSNPTHSIKTFHELLEALDDLVLTKAKENSVDWIGIKKSKAHLVDEKYRRQIQFSKNENLERDNKYPDSVRFKLPYDAENKTFYNSLEIYDENGEFQSVKVVEDMEKWLTAGSSDISVVQLNSIYFVGGNFGLSWKVVQVQAFPSTRGLQGFSIMNEDDEDVDMNQATENDGDEEA
jgi:hypothetical protein